MAKFDPATSPLLSSLSYSLGAGGTRCEATQIIYSHLPSLDDKENMVSCIFTMVSCTYENQHGTSWNIMEHHGTSWNIMEPKNPHLANQRKNRPTSIFEAQSMNMFRVPPVKSHQNPAKNQS
jgi:hypothetical protein